MEGFYKYKEIYKKEIEDFYAKHYESLKKQKMSNEERIDSLNGLKKKEIKFVGALGSSEVRLSWINKKGYVISKYAEYRVWKKFNEDNHELFGIRRENIIDKSELDELKLFIYNKRSKHKMNVKYDALESDGCVLIDVNDNFKYKKVSVKKNRDKIKEVIVKDYYDSDLSQKLFSVDEDGKKIKRFKVNKDKVLRFYRDRKQLFSDLDKIYYPSCRWIIKKFEHFLEYENNIGWFLDRIICTIYYEVKYGKLLPYSGRLSDMESKGYINRGSVNAIVMSKRDDMGDSDEEMIKWIIGYKERKKKYDDDYKVKKVLRKGIKDNFDFYEVE